MAKTDDDKLQARISALLDPHDRSEENEGEQSEWVRQARKVLVPSPPGYDKSYTEIEAELIAGGVPVPPGIKMLAAAERDENGKLRGVIEH